MSNDTREALAARAKDAVRRVRLVCTGGDYSIHDRAAAVDEAFATIDRLAAVTEQPAAQPVAHFLNNAADGEPPHYAQVAAEYIGTEGVFPLYKHPPQAAAAPQALTDEQRLYLSQAADLLDEYGAECSRGGADSTAKGCEASAYALRQLLRAAPAAPAQERGVQAEPRHGALISRIANLEQDNEHLRLEVARLQRAAPAQEPQQPAQEGIPYVATLVFDNETRTVQGVIPDAAASSPAPAVQPAEAVAELVEALRVARDHIEMDALRISHCKDAALITDALAKHGQQGGSNA